MFTTNTDQITIYKLPMKTLNYLLFTLFILIPSVLLGDQDYLPDLQLILKKCIEAHGSERAIEHIHSVRLSGFLSQGSQTVKIVIVKKRPDKTRLKIDYSPQSYYIKSYNGEQLWEKETDVPPRLLPKNSTDSFIRDPGLFFHLLHLKENGANVSLLGKAKIGNLSCFQLLLRLPNAEEITYFIDDQEFLERKSTFIENNEPVNLLYSDFKTVDGLKIPFKVVKLQPKDPELLLNIQNVDFNVGISDNFFDIKTASNSTTQ